MSGPMVEGRIRPQRIGVVLASEEEDAAFRVPLTPRVRRYLRGDIR